MLAPPSDARWPDAWGVTEALVVAIRDEAAEHGARLVVATLSSAVQVTPDEAARAAMERELGVDDLFYPDRRIHEF